MEFEAEVVEDSDETLIEIKELNDVEFDLPMVAPQSLESVLWDMVSEEGSDNTSINSLPSLSLTFRSMLYHCILQGISSQVSSAGERVQAGLPTVITNSSKYVSIGTSHGYVLTFDSEQRLCWYSNDNISTDQGAISALCFNIDSSRILVGYERGYIAMLDALNGNVIRRIPDAHAPQSAVLQLRFTALNNLALVGDSSGCVFSLSFLRHLGIRSWDSKCLFSGARGEVCCFEPLIQGQDLLANHIIIAMATLSKVIIISIKPRLRVLFSQQLPRVPMSLPHLSWQLVLVGKTWQPVLAWGRSTELNYTRIIFAGISNNKLRLSPLRTVQLPYSIAAVHWIGNRHLAILDTSENLRLIEVRTQKELELLELTSAGLVYNSAHFKALAAGGGVSEAFALAGERACYNSLSSRGGQLLVLGTKAVHMVRLRSWMERLIYLSDQGRWAEALNLAADEGNNYNREKGTAILFEKYFHNFATNKVDKDCLTAAVNCCVKLDKIDLLCNELWDSISSDQCNQELLYSLLAGHICNGLLTCISPGVAQALISHLEQHNVETLKQILLSLDISCLDLHQVLSICKKRKLYEAWIHITTKTIKDYTSPLTEFLSDLTPDNHALGNTILVYISACLAGLGYPKGYIIPSDVLKVKFDVLRCLEAQHSINSNENEQTYPYLRALLKFNTRESLNVVKLAFTENEFSGDMGLLQRQRLVEILMHIVIQPEFNDSQILILSCFIAKLVASNNLNVDKSMLDRVIGSLTDIVDMPLSVREHTEREQAWLDLLNSNNLSHLSSTDLLNIIIKSKCFKVAEYLYEIKKDYSNILSCYLKDPLRKSEVFNYILTYIKVTERCILEQFLANFKELVVIDCKQCVDIINEHFPSSIQTIYLLIESDVEVEYLFLSELILSDIKIPPHIAERYLELICERNPKYVCNYVQLSYCRVEQALKITKKYDLHLASAILLEQLGEYAAALDLLLEHKMAEVAIELCVRGAAHLDNECSQQLWFALLENPNTYESISIRQFLHSAAPHVPPRELLEYISDARFGDIKTILKCMLTDCSHDIEVLTSTLQLLGRDLHQGLAKALSINGRGLPVTKTVCNICQVPFFQNQPMTDQTISIWGCGHCFHVSCYSIDEYTSQCFLCRDQAVCVCLESVRTNCEDTRDSNIRVRPDLEGHF